MDTFLGVVVGILSLSVAVFVGTKYINHLH